MIPRAALQARASEWGLTEEVVEKDYVLGWLLAGIGGHRILGATWIFKGGTALKKCYVETYRFSEDLDFTVIEDGPLKPDDLLPVLDEVLDALEQQSGIALTSRSPIVRMRPDGQSAEGRIYYRGPRGAPGDARVKLDLTYNEVVVEPTARRPISHAYDDELPGDASVNCYSFPEVFAEKLRALGQRTRPRDLYDIVNLSRRDDLRGESERVMNVLAEKCAFKNIEVPTLATVTTPEKVGELSADWGAMLGHQLPALPPVQEFLEALPIVFDWLAGTEAAALASAPVLGESIESSWSAPLTMMRWQGGAPLEQVRFAGANHLLVELRYRGTSQLIEPYSLRRSKAGDLLLFAIKAASGELRSYRVDRIEGVTVTSQSFAPRYAVELSSSMPRGLHS
ncbi:MAG: nucleotidyl transferase AbiEii/AbiGii toxin family protein [Solirubrobacterales bacterium]